MGWAKMIVSDRIRQSSNVIFSLKACNKTQDCYLTSLPDLYIYIRAKIAVNQTQELMQSLNYNYCWGYLSDKVTIMVRKQILISKMVITWLDIENRDNSKKMLRNSYMHTLHD